MFVGWSLILSEEINMNAYLKTALIAIAAIAVVSRVDAAKKLVFNVA